LIERELTEELLCSLAALSDTDVVYGLYDGTVKTLHLEDGKREALGEHHAKAVTAVVAIDNKTFASGSADGIIKIWRLDKQNRFVCTQTLQEHTVGIVSLAVNAHYELFSLAEDGEMKIWRR
jgi:WD40 repeat protein